ncbi:MAG: MarR family transcriptional regulator [Oscillospiraceae bacterium]|nr:MarR family transcriptional regulator [Oscillospiraceae bacterium]
MEQARQLLRVYLRVSQLISRQFRSYFSRQDLTFPQAMVLTALGEEGEMPISQLAQCTGSTNSTVSGIVDRLERMGLVKRVRSEQDRRVIYVALTESSRAMERAVEPDVNAQMSRMLTDLTAQELEKIRGALETLERVLDKEAQQE